MPAGTRVDWRRLGTDVCEDFFSSLGSFNMNKRTYSIGEALESTRNLIILEKLAAGGCLVVPKRKGAKWVEDWKQEERGGGDGGDDGDDDDDGGGGDDDDGWRPPTDGEIIETWKRGVAAGKAMATKDKMKPRRATVDWWARPETNDPKAYDRRNLDRKETSVIEMDGTRRTSSRTRRKASKMGLEVTKEETATTTAMTTTKKTICHCQD